LLTKSKTETLKTITTITNNKNNHYQQQQQQQPTTNQTNQQINMMNISAPSFALLLGLFAIYEDSIIISVSAFAPAAALPPTAMKNHNKAASS
jgi:hypothetical protein